ncbi:MAG: 2-dehydro-3-deoxygalactonokinase [Burkholderiaceae bacterium]
MYLALDLPTSADATGQRARLIALDWGTSSLRGWLLAADGQVLERREGALGILNLAHADFRSAFESFCAGWLDADPGLPVIAAGMIGSRQGWAEAPYIETPASLADLADGLLALDSRAGRPFRIVPGLVSRPADGTADVLRGEETQVFGALAGAPAGERLFVLPGTHSKWVATRGLAVTGFRTCMTGELYAVMRQYAILGRLCEEPAIADGPGQLAAFDDGVALGLARPGAIGHLLFTVRSQGLLGLRPADCLPAYLSGLLIGAEIGDGLASFAPTAPPCIIASPALAARYHRAFARAGIDTDEAAGEPACAGLLALARPAFALEED